MSYISPYLANLWHHKHHIPHDITKNITLSQYYAIVNLTKHRRYKSFPEFTMSRIIAIICDLPHLLNINANLRLISLIVFQAIKYNSIACLHAILPFIPFDINWTKNIIKVSPLPIIKILYPKLVLSYSTISTVLNYASRDVIDYFISDSNITDSRHTWVLDHAFDHLDFEINRENFPILAPLIYKSFRPANLAWIVKHRDTELFHEFLKLLNPKYSYFSLADINHDPELILICVRRGLSFNISSLLQSQEYALACVLCQHNMHNKNVTLSDINPTQMAICQRFQITINVKPVNVSDIELVMTYNLMMTALDPKLESETFIDYCISNGCFLDLLTSVLAVQKLYHHGHNLTIVQICQLPLPEFKLAINNKLDDPSILERFTSYAQLLYFLDCVSKTTIDIIRKKNYKHSIYRFLCLGLFDCADLLVLRLGSIESHPFDFFNARCLNMEMIDWYLNQNVEFLLTDGISRYNLRLFLAQTQNEPGANFTMFNLNNTILEMIIQKHNVNILQFLTRNGIQTDVIKDNIVSLINCAIKFYAGRCLLFLVREYVDFIPENMFESIFQYAISNNKIEILMVLLNHNIKLPIGVNFMVMHAHRNNKAAMRHLFQWEQKQAGCQIL